MGCAVSTPHDDATWAATGALGSTGRVVDAPSLRLPPVAPKPEPELEPEHGSVASPIALSDLDELRILGVGSFGVVTLVRHRPDGKIYGESQLPASSICDCPIPCTSR